MSYDYDITIIGGGPGGYVAAIQAGKAGKKTCLIEKETLGGTCLNMGCIPTKTLLESAKRLRDIKKASSYGLIGVNFSDASVDMKKVQERKNLVTNQLVSGVRSLLVSNKVKIIEGEARFIDSHKLAVGDKVISSEYVIVASGSAPAFPSSIKISGKKNLLTSKEILSLESVPQTMIVLGGGVVGIELASVLNIFGCKTTIIEGTDKILPASDREISELVKKRLEKDGISFYLNAKIKEIENNQVSFEQNGVNKSISAECVLMALGRIPCTEGLDIEVLGLDLDGNAIKCDNTLRSSIDNIYVIGDANGKAMLAQTAFQEGMIAVKNICGETKQINYDMIPFCAYTEPEVACIGMSEEVAIEKYGEEGIRIGRFPLYANGRSLTEGDTEGMIKVILERELGEVIGVHMYGRHVTEMIYGITAAMNSEATAEEIIESVFPHPTVSEAICEAFLAAWTGQAIHSI